MAMSKVKSRSRDIAHLQPSKSLAKDQFHTLCGYWSIARQDLKGQDH